MLLAAKCSDFVVVTEFDSDDITVRIKKIATFVNNMRRLKKTCRRHNSLIMFLPTPATSTNLWRPPQGLFLPSPGPRECSSHIMHKYCKSYDSHSTLHGAALELFNNQRKYRNWFPITCFHYLRVNSVGHITENN